MLRRQAVANSIAAGLIVAALVVGAASYYILTTYSVRTETVTTTQSVTETMFYTTTLTTSGSFGTFSSSANLALIIVSCYSGTTGAGNLATSSYCILAIANTGGSSGSVTGCSLYGSTGISGKLATQGSLPPITAGTVAVPAGTTSAAPIYVGCDNVALTSGATVTGALIVAGGSPLAFSAIAS